VCGIAGIINLKPSPPIEADVLARMIAALRHRGPDEFGIYRDEWAGLGSARLSIVDLEGGQQPIGNEDGTVWTVFNGEIFNYVEVRADLEARGHTFSTRCDTETLVHLYEEYGPGFASRLNGQFALAVWDARKRELLLARDRMGIRPLFYTQVGGQLVFASEIKALLCAPGVRAELDPSALHQIFTYWSVPPPRTAFKGILEVPPASYLLLTEDRVRLGGYWEPDFTPDPSRRTDDEYLAEFEALLTDATNLRLWADVPVGAYLSGGVDSSVVAALVRARGELELDTFSIAFSDDRFDESAYQRRMAEFLGTRHQEVLCTHQDIAHAFPDVIWHTESPILRTAPAPMFLLSRLVHQRGYKVVLTGEGADEILAGYDIFKEMRVRRFWARRPESALRPLLLRRLYPDIPAMGRAEAFRTEFFRQGLEATESPAYSHALRWQNTGRIRRFLSQDSAPTAGPSDLPYPLPPRFAAWSHLGRAQYLEMVSFLSPYLLSSQGDRMAMAHSVEGRYPFLDYRVVEFCGRLPDDLKQRGLTEKWLLKRLARRILPEEIWRRVKRPFRAPIRRTFFSGDHRPDYIDELLSPESLRRTAYFHPGAVTGLVNKARTHDDLGEMDEMALVGILSTQLVDHLYLRQRPLTVETSPLPRLKTVDAARNSILI
jgi:asparagine synthase (glutamine-hydrolysing)